MEQEVRDDGRNALAASRRGDGEQVSLALVMQGFRMFGVIQTSQQVAFPFLEAGVFQIIVSGPFG